MPTEKRAFGDKGEEIAAAFLQKKGYRIIEKNFLVHRGEIDIIARSKQRGLVFVEVKTRKNTTFGTPVESISEKKAQRLIAAAYAYMRLHKCEHEDFSIDVIGILFPGPTITHIQDAICGM